MPKPTSEPPKEVEKLLASVRARLKNAGGWGAEDWNVELTRLYKLSVDHELGLHEADPNILILPGGDVGQIGVPLVQVIEPRDEGFWLPRERLPALIVNLNASDAVILAAVKCVLQERTKRLGAPVLKPGRTAPNSCFDKRTFAKWRREGIVEFAELLAWNAKREADGEPSYTELVLGKWINEEKSAKETSEAKVLLKDALASLPALAAQR